MRVRVMAEVVGPWGLRIRELILPTWNSSLRGYCVPVMRAPFSAAAIKRKAAMVGHFRNDDHLCSDRPGRCRFVVD